MRPTTALLAAALFIAAVAAPSAQAAVVKSTATTCAGLAAAQAALKAAYETATRPSPITLKLELDCAGGRGVGRGMQRERPRTGGQGGPPSRPLRQRCQHRDAMRLCMRTYVRCSGGRQAAGRRSTLSRPLQGSGSHAPWRHAC